MSTSCCFARTRGSRRVLCTPLSTHRSALMASTASNPPLWMGTPEVGACLCRVLFMWPPHDVAWWPGWWLPSNRLGTQVRLQYLPSHRRHRFLPTLHVSCTISLPPREVEAGATLCGAVWLSRRHCRTVACPARCRGTQRRVARVITTCQVVCRPREASWQTKWVRCCAPLLVSVCLDAFTVTDLWCVRMLFVISQGSARRWKFWLWWRATHAARRYYPHVSASVAVATCWTLSTSQNGPQPHSLLALPWVAW